jgi:hypothetical protein
MQRDARLSRRIHQRSREETQSYYKEHGNAVFVRDVEICPHESHDHQPAEFGVRIFASDSTSAPR